MLYPKKADEICRYTNIHILKQSFCKLDYCLLDGGTEYPLPIVISLVIICNTALILQYIY